MKKDGVWQLFSFKGHIGRSTYWLVQLPLTAFAVLTVYALGQIPSLIMLCVVIFMGWIFLAVGTKRWHDRDKSGWVGLGVLNPGNRRVVDSH